MLTEANAAGSYGVPASRQREVALLVMSPVLLSMLHCCLASPDVQAPSCTLVPFTAPPMMDTHRPDSVEMMVPVARAGGMCAHVSNVSRLALTRSRSLLSVSVSLCVALDLRSCIITIALHLPCLVLVRRVLVAWMA